MKDTSNEESQQQHAHNDEGRDHEGDYILLRWEEIIDGVPGGVGGLLILQLQAGLQTHHLKHLNVVWEVVAKIIGTNNQVKT